MNPKQNKPKDAPIDLDQVLKRVGQDKEFLHELIDIYREEFPEKLKSLEKSIAEKDYPVIQEIGHYLKGSSANLGLTHLQEESCAVECAGKEKNILKAQKAFENLNKEYKLFNRYYTEKLS